MPRLLLTTLLVLSSMVFTFPAYTEVSLQTEISQMLIIGFKGKTLTANSPIIQTLQQYPIGGVILFNSSHGPEPDAESAITNVVSPKQLRALTMTLQHYSQIPLFIGVDQEGGRVERLTEAEGFSHMPSAAHLGHLNDVAYTKKQATQLANMLAHVGINLDFTPVVDLALNPKNIVIVQHRRSFSKDPHIVVSQATAVAQALNTRHIACSYKHFPGHGSSADDTHLGFVDVTHTWRREELIPYEQLIPKHLCDFVMMAHVYNRHLDPDYPASLSQKIIQGILRQQLHFDGLVITDALKMKAISSRYTLAQSLMLAINAGNDMLLFSNMLGGYDPHLAQKLVLTITGLVNEGKIKRATIDRAYQHILATKRHQGLLLA